MNLQGKINVIKEAKDDIKDAIIAKGVIPSGNISTYADAISEIDTTNNTSLTVTPSTVSQTLRPSSSYTGYDVVNVQAVTNSIDENIVATNIKNGVSILGVNGSVIELNGETKTITENGTYTPSGEHNGFTSVTVNTPIGITREIKNNKYQMPTTENFTFTLPSNALDLGNYALYSAFQNCSTITIVNLNSLSSISGNYALGSAFANCNNLQVANFYNLQSISGTYPFNYAFDNCVKLTDVFLPNLSNISVPFALYHAFRFCSLLSSLEFPSLKSSSFGGYNSQFSGMLVGVTGCTVHFPSNLQSVIGSWTDVTNGFGGTNTTILFDLEATT